MRGGEGRCGKGRYTESAAANTTTDARRSRLWYLFARFEGGHRFVQEGPQSLRRGTFGFVQETLCHSAQLVDTRGGDVPRAVAP